LATDRAEPERERREEVTPEARVLETFVKNGRIVQVPRQNAKRRLILDLLAQEFELGVNYSEREVNEILARWHPDTAAWRRYLVDEEFMERDPTGSLYWRAGGTVHV
jgi:hypothetical protein